MEEEATEDFDDKNENPRLHHFTKVTIGGSLEAGISEQGYMEVIRQQLF